MFEKILGKFCVRCGKQRTRTEFEGLPTCSTCEVQIEADREETRPCPQCTIEMNKLVVQNIIVDQCPQCHGAWLDAGELELLQDAINAGAGDLATGMVLGMAIG